jgi:hypothetical protein
MAGAKILLSTVAGELQKDANNYAMVNAPLVAEHAGFAVGLSEVDTGECVAGNARTIYSPEATDDYRLRVGMDTILFSMNFEGTAVARDRWQQNDSTMTCSQSTGFFTLNSGNSITVSQATNIRTYRTFPLFGSFTTYFEAWIREANIAATNVTSEWGFGYAATTVAQMTDGVIFRRVSGGQLRAVVISSATGAGVDVQAVDIDTTNVPNRDGTGTFDPTQVQHYVITVHHDESVFWINDCIVARIKTNSAYGSPTNSSHQPVFFRINNTGAVVGGARTLAVGAVSVSQGEMNTSRPWGHTMCLGGGGAYQVQPGSTSGPTVTRGTGALGWPNSGTARAAGTWTATTAPATNSLGGLWQSPAISTLTADADYPVFSFANPAGTATLPGKTLVITGIKWGKTIALTAAASNNCSLNFIVGVGGTSSASTQTEAAAVVAARGVVLDSIPFKSSAAIHDFVEGGEMSFGDAPLVVPPGCFVTFVVRINGTVASNTLSVQGSVAFAGYFE